MGTTNRAWFPVAVIALILVSDWTGVSTAGANEPADEVPAGMSTPLQLFEERIMPIFRSPRPSSCVQCHLASVDLRNYILPSHEQTFAALRAKGLVDLQNPDQSKILTLIRMGQKDADEKARRIHARTRKAELQAFSVWIKACCKDPKLRELKTSADLSIGPEYPDEIIRHARKSRVVDSFARNIWSQRMRCFPCHTPHELDPENPAHAMPIKRHAENVATYGQKMNIFRESPEATLDQLIASSRRSLPERIPLLNLEAPASSLLVLKPTSKLPPKNAAGQFAKPSSTVPVSHMGGLKMHVNDQSYKSFVTWIQDYANVVGGEYQEVKDLPADNWRPTQKVLRLTDVPLDWGDQTAVQLFVHAATDQPGTWSKTPVAFTQNLITPRRMVMGPLSLINFDTTDSIATAAPLRPGKYLIRIYIDSEHKLDDAPSLLLGGDDFVGETTVEADWKVGFKQAEVISATNLTK